MPSRSAYTQLIAFADARKYRSASDCRGLCFDASAELACEAVRLGFEQQTHFVRWRVQGDPGFLEHWALRLGDGTVVDITAVQVDGNSQPVREIDRYPANYGQARLYPVPLILKRLKTNHAIGRYRYSGRAIWAVHYALFRHDASRAIRQRAPRALMAAFGAMGQCAVKLAAGHLLTRAITYRRALQNRPK